MSGPSAPFGQIIGRLDVENAVLNLLSEWMVTYIAEVERNEGLAAHTIPVPPSADSYHGGLDFDTWRQGLEPVVIVNAEPTEDAERRGTGEYSQWFEVHVAAICVADQKFYDPNTHNQVEDAARHLADFYGKAILGLLTQQLNNGNGPAFMVRSDLLISPTTEFISPEVPSVARAVGSWRMLVHPVVDESQGPTTVPSDPYATPNPIPDVETENLTVTFDASNVAP